MNLQSLCKRCVTPCWLRFKQELPLISLRFFQSPNPFPSPDRSPGMLRCRCRRLRRCNFHLIEYLHWIASGATWRCWPLWCTWGPVNYCRSINAENGEIPGKETWCNWRPRLLRKNSRLRREKLSKMGMDQRLEEWAGFASNIRWLLLFFNLDWCGQSGRAILVDDNKLQDALKLHAAGRPIPRADLPDPPGFAPIPISDTPQVLKYCQE